MEREFDEREREIEEMQRGEEGVGREGSGHRKDDVWRMIICGEGRSGVEREEFKWEEEEDMWKSVGEGEKRGKL